MKRDAFHVILTFIVSICMLCNASFAEGISPVRWYPYDIHADDTYVIASEKVSDALSGQNTERRMKSVWIKPTNYFLYGIPVKDVCFMDKGETWLLYISANVSLSLEDIEKVYELYTALSEKLGTPVNSSPKVQLVSFDETKEISVFDSKEIFSSSLESAKEKDSFSAFFDYCTLEINAWDYFNVQLILTFNNIDLPTQALPAATVTPTLSPTPEVTPTLTPKPTAVPTFSPPRATEPARTPKPTISRIRTDITALQLLLIQYGYLIGSASGEYDDDTVTAVKDFQVNNDLPETGQCDEETLRKMESQDCWKQIIVYKSRRGKVYHSNDYCSGMKTAQPMTLSEALRMGLTPCPHCH